MNHWLRLALQVASLALFVLILVWGGPDAWHQIAGSDPRCFVISLLLLGAASMLSAARLQIIARSMAGHPVAPWTRFYYLSMTTRAIGLVMPRTLSTVGGKAVGLGALGVPAGRALWIVLLDNGLDLLVLAAATGPALLFLSYGLGWEFLGACLVVLALLAAAWWWLTSAGTLSPTSSIRRLVAWAARRLPRLGGMLPGSEAQEALNLFPPRPATLAALGWTAALNSLLALCYYAISRSIGLAQPWTVYAAGFAVTQLSLVVAVTPGGLGLVDAGWYGVLLLAGVPTQQALTFVIAQRAFIFVHVLAWAGASVLLSLALERPSHA